MSPATAKTDHIDFKTIFAGAIFAGGLVWAAHVEISKIDDRLAALDKHISRVETATRIIGAKQGGDTKTLIDEALTVAKNAVKAGHTDDAKAIVAYANQLLEEQKRSRPKPPNSSSRLR